MAYDCGTGDVTLHCPSWPGVCEAHMQRTELLASVTRGFSLHTWPVSQEEALMFVESV